jgi:predicted DNA-binding transcriptional regulator AlpA
MQAIKLITRPEVLAKLRIKNTALWDRVKCGTITPPMDFGGNSKLYAENEIDAIIMARSAGYNDEQIKTLVTQLVSKRNQDASAYLKSHSLDAS